MSHCRSSLLIVLLLAWSTTATAAIVSLEGNFVAGESNVVGHLNRDRQALTDGVNNIRGTQSGGIQTAGQLRADTIAEENMADDANPRIYLDDLFIRNLDDNNGLVARGLEFATSTNLTASASAGVAYTRGYQITKNSATSRTFTANRWTYAFICQDGSFSYVERAIGTADLTTADYPTNCQPLSRVSTDGTTVVSVTDRRKLKFTLESYDSVFDDSLESSSKKLFQGGTTGSTDSSYRTGAALKYLNASSYQVTAGAAMIAGEARDRGTFNSNAAWPVASAADQDGLDVGTQGTGTYYVYLVADENRTRTYRVVHSLSATTPTGKTNYMKIGEFRNEGGTISQDSVVSYIWGESLGGNPQRQIGGWISWNGTAGTVNDQYNVSSFTKNATGDYTLTWGIDFANGNYAVTCMSSNVRQLPNLFSDAAASHAVGAARIAHSPGDSGVLNDQPWIACLAIGDR